MKDKIKIVQTVQGWFVETDNGRVGPMDSEKEAKTYLRLMRIASGAGFETACTDKECFV